MERFRIAQYGFIQMVALAYGILGSGAAARAGRVVEDNDPLPTTLLGWAIHTFREYGFLLSIVIVGWAIFCAYNSTTLSRRNIEEDTIVTSGMALALVFFALGSLAIFMTLGSLVAT